MIKKYILPVLIVVLVAIVACAVYFYQKASTNSIPTTAQSEDQNTLDRVKKLILLPEGEVPTIATVSNLDKLKDQAFFAKATLGDKVLMYPKAQKAYLYDPVHNRILEVAPLAINDAVPPPANQTVAPAPKTTSIPKPKAK